MPPPDKPAASGAVDNRIPRLRRSATLPHRGTRRGTGWLRAGPVGAGRWGLRRSAAAAPVQAGRVWRVMVLVGVLAFVAAAAGILVPATHTTRTTADEPQYLLTAISLAEDRRPGHRRRAGRRPLAVVPRAGAARADRAAGGRASAEPSRSAAAAAAGRAGGGRRLGRGQAGHGGHGRAAGRPAGVDGRAPPRRAAGHGDPGHGAARAARRRWPSTAARSTRSSRRPWPSWRRRPRSPRRRPRAGRRPW